MSDRTAALAVGVFFILLSIGTAMGSVSLGTYERTTQSGYVQGSYLVYNSLFQALALLLALAGGYFFYQSGKSAGFPKSQASG